MSEFDNQREVYLIFGKNGWIGGKIIELLTQQGKTFYLAESRTYNREAVLLEIEKYNPTHILNAAGVTGRPNVDWCEDHRLETIRSNVIGTLTIADIAEEVSLLSSHPCLPLSLSSYVSDHWLMKKNLHHTLFATGCIFEYDEAHPIGGKGFTEDDIPNFHGSYYSHTKAMVEDMLRAYANTLTLRVRMPISDDLSPRNFVTKIVKYDRVSLSLLTSFSRLIRSRL